MPALNLSYLLNSAGRALEGARAGAFEREELNRQREIEDSTRMFNEWAKRNQAAFQNRQLDSTNINRQILAEQARLNEEGRNQRSADRAADMMDRTRFQADIQKQIAELKDATARRGQNIGALEIKIGTDGKPYAVDPLDETTRNIGSQTFPLPGSGGGSGRQTVQERTAAAQYELAKPAHDRLSAKFDEGWKPKTRDKLGEAIKFGYIPDFLGNIVQSDDGQQMYDDLTALILASQYALSGKAVNKNEAQQLARGLMPQMGDKPERAAQKRDEIDTRLRVVMASGGKTEGINEPPPPRLTAKPSNPYRK